MLEKMHRNNLISHWHQSGNWVNIQFGGPLFCLFLGPFQNFRREASASCAYSIIRPCKRKLYVRLFNSRGDENRWQHFSLCSSCSTNTVYNSGWYIFCTILISLLYNFNAFFMLIFAFFTCQGNFHGVVLPL